MTDNNQPSPPPPPPQPVGPNPGFPIERGGQQGGRRVITR